ncbi:MAG: hypothetical protein ACMUFK_02465 [Thermoplasmatota archaeon]
MIEEGVDMGRKAPVEALPVHSVSCGPYARIIIAMLSKSIVNEMVLDRGPEVLEPCIGLVR